MPRRGHPRHRRPAGRASRGPGRDLRVDERRRRAPARSGSARCACSGPTVRSGTRGPASRRFGTSTGRSTVTSARSRTSRTSREHRTRAELALKNAGRGRSTGGRDVASPRDRVRRRRRRTGHRRARTSGPRSSAPTRRCSRRGPVKSSAVVCSQHAWHNPDLGTPAAGDGRRLAHRYRRGDRLGHAVLAAGPAAGPARTASRWRSSVTRSSPPWPGCGPSARCGSARSGSVRSPSTRRTSCSSTTRSAT